MAHWFLAGEIGAFPPEAAVVELAAGAELDTEVPQSGQPVEVLVETADAVVDSLQLAHPVDVDVVVGSLQSAHEVGETVTVVYVVDWIVVVVPQSLTGSTPQAAGSPNG